MFLFFLGSEKVERPTALPRQITGCRIKCRVEERKLQVSRSWDESMMKLMVAQVVMSLESAFVSLPVILSLSLVILRLKSDPANEFFG